MAITAIQGIARRFIPAMLKQGLSTSAGLRMLQGQGLGYRKTKFLTDWREFAGIERKRDPLRSIPKKYRPTEFTIQRTEFEQRAKFNYNFDVEGYDLIQQKDVIEQITVASEEILTMQEAEEEAQRLADQYKVDIDIAKIMRDSVTVRS